MVNSLNKRLEAMKVRWVKELPGVLWAYHTTPKTSTGKSPYYLVYGMEAIIPTEVISSTLQAKDEN